MTLALFETLVDLNCEDVMLELCLGALAPCSHVMLSQRRRLRDVDPFGRGAEKFLSLTPSCCVQFPTITAPPTSRSLPQVPLNSRRRSSASNSSNYSTPSDSNFASLQTPINYGSKHTESLYGNYHAYLYDARQKIVSCQNACSHWSHQYDGEPPKQSKSNSGTLTDDKNTLVEQVNLWRIENDDMNLTKNMTVSNEKTVENSKLRSPEAPTNSKNEIVELTECFPMTENILDNIQSLLEEDDRLEEVLSDSKNEIKNDPDITDGSEQIRRPLSAEEQGRLDADIAELLGEDLGTASKVYGIRRTSSSGDNEGQSHGESRSYEKRGAFESEVEDSATAMNSLLSLGESSGYESFAFKGSSESTPENEHSEDRSSEHNEITGDNMRLAMIGENSTGVDETGIRVMNSCDNSTNENSEIEETSVSGGDTKNQITSRQDIFNGKPNVGIFLDVLLRKLECMTSNNVYVNLHLTGLISRLAIYPQPLLQSFLLNHSLVFQPSIRSLLQVNIRNLERISFFYVKTSLAGLSSTKWPQKALRSFRKK